jgi:hypothetical protein
MATEKPTAPERVEDPGYISIEEYEKSEQYLNARTPSKGGMKHSISSPNSTMPSTIAKPRLVAGPRSSGHIVKFFEMWAKQGIFGQPAFNFTREGASHAPSWKGEVSFLDVVIRDDAAWPSKQEAKDSVCEKALAHLEDHPFQNKTTAQQDPESQAVDNETNWKGILMGRYN